MERRGPAGQRQGQVGSSLWIGDVKRMLRTNLGTLDGAVWLVTITAPGADLLPCSPATCSTKGEHPQREAAGCRVDSAAAVRWNRSAARRWSELNRRAAQAVRRSTGLGSPVIAAVWQLQRRGVLHLHLVLDYAHPGAREFVAELRARTAQFAFGYVDARDRGPRSTVMEGRRAAYYLSKYATSGQLSEAVALRDRPRRLVYVARSLTALTGCTMRRLRRVRFLFWLRRGSRLFCHAGRLPAWFRDPVEHRLVAALADAARAP